MHIPVTSSLLDGPGADFMRFAASENAALRPSAWERWAQAVEAALGFDLDGDDSDDARRAGTSDGYSLDGAYDAWRRGDETTVSELAALELRGLGLRVARKKDVIST